MVHNGFKTFVATPCRTTKSSRETEAPRLGPLPRIVRKRIRIRCSCGTRFSANDERLVDGNHFAVEVEERIRSGSSADLLQVALSP